MKFTFDVPGAGWAEASFEAGGARYDVTVSYLSDAPRDLLLSAAALLRGAPESRVTLMEEPGEVIAVLRRLDAERLRLALYYGEDQGRAAPDRDAPVFSADVALRRYAAAVATEFRRLERELGPAEYRARWKLYEFPHEALRALEGLVGT